MSIQTNKLPDNPNIEVIKAKETGLFTNYIYKAIPLAFDESMSYYETLCGLLNYLQNTIIPTVNNNADAVAELQSLYEQLRSYVDTYFTNLDVQQEINNKLDDMVESGQLTDIIAQYLGLAGMITFNNVTEMKLAENLVNGSKCCTLGFYNVNDGGSSFYKIRTITNDDVIDNMSIIGLYDDTLIAELIINNEMSVKQFGAKGDGETNDTLAINTALSKCNNIVIPSGTFMVKAHNGNIINDYPNFNGSIVLNNNNHLKINGTIQCITNDYYYYQVINVIGDNVCIEGGNIYGDKLTHTGLEASEFGYCVNILSAKNTTIKNCNIAYGWGDSIALSSLTSNDPTYNCKNIIIKDCTLHDSRRQGISIIGANNVTVKDCEIYNISGINPQNGIDIESNYADDNPVKNVLIDNVYIHDTTGASITTTAKSENVNIINSNLYNVFNVNGKNIVYDNCIFNKIANGSTNPTLILNSKITGEISVYNGGKVNIDNCETNERFTSDNNNEEIVINNSTLNFINSTNPQMFIIRNTDSLKINNSTITTDKSLGTIYAKELIVENCIINNLTDNVDGFFTKDFIFKNNFIKGKKMYRTIVVQNGTVSSYIKDNIYETKPDFVIGGTSSQNIFIINNISASALATTGTLDSVINVDNYTNSST